MNRGVKLTVKCAALSLLFVLAACSQRPPDALSHLYLYDLEATATSETTVVLNLPQDVLWSGRPYPETYVFEPHLSVVSVDTSESNRGVVTVTTSAQSDDTYTVTLPNAEVTDGEPLRGPISTTFQGGGQSEDDYSPVIPDSTKVVTSQQDVTSYSESSLQLAANSSLAANLKVGDVIVSAPIPGVAPYGFLRKVTAIVPQSGGTTLALEEASLEEAVEQGELAEEFTLSTADIVSSTEGNNVFVEDTLSTQGLGINLNILNEILCDSDGNLSTTDDQITLNGSIQADLKPFVDLRIRWFSLRHFEAGMGVDESANITLSGKCGKEIKKEKLLEKIDFKTFVFAIGPVPVVVTPSIEIYIGAKGEVSIKVNYEVRQEFEARYGTRWDRSGGWSRINEVNSTFEHTPPSIEGKAKVRGYVGAKAGLRFYGAAFVYVYPQAYAEAEATLSLGSSSVAPSLTTVSLTPLATPSTSSSATYSYCIYAGLDLGFGAKVSVFKKNLGEWNSKRLDLIKKEIVCGESDAAPIPDPPPQPEPPTPPDPPAPQPAPPSLTCLSEGSYVSCYIDYTGSQLTTVWSVSGGTLYYGGSEEAYIGCSSNYVSVNAKVTYGSDTTTLYGGASCSSGMY